MSIIAEVSDDLPVTTAEVVAQSRGDKSYAPTGDSFRLAYMDLPGSERFQLGITASVRAMRVYADLDSGERPFTEKSYLRIAGEVWNVMGIQRIPDAELAGVMAIVQRED